MPLGLPWPPSSNSWILCSLASSALYASVTCPSDYWKRLAIAATNGLLDCSGKPKAKINDDCPVCAHCGFYNITWWARYLTYTHCFGVRRVDHSTNLWNYLNNHNYNTHTHVLLDPVMSYRVKQESNVQHAQAVQLMAEPLTW